MPIYEFDIDTTSANAFKANSLWERNPIAVACCYICGCPYLSHYATKTDVTCIRCSPNDPDMSCVRGHSLTVEYYDKHTE